MSKAQGKREGHFALADRRCSGHLPGGAGCDRGCRFWDKRRGCLVSAWWRACRPTGKK